MPPEPEDRRKKHPLRDGLGEVLEVAGDATFNLAVEGVIRGVGLVGRIAVEVIGSALDGV